MLRKNHNLYPTGLKIWQVTKMPFNEKLNDHKI